MLRISHADYESLREHGERTYPHECCGVLLGRAGEGVNDVVRIVRGGEYADGFGA